MIWSSAFTGTPAFDSTATFRGMPSLYGFSYCCGAIGPSVAATCFSPTASERLSMACSISTRKCLNAREFDHDFWQVLANARV